MFRILNCCEYLRDGILVVLHRYFGFNLILADLFVTDHRTVHADSFNQTLAEQVFVRHVQNLIL